VPTTNTSQDARSCIKRLRRRFERWELTHLRELAASLHDQLQEAEQQAYDADRRADMFFDMHNCISQELEQCGKAVGITQNGELSFVNNAPTRSVCDDFGNLVEVAS
jgi:hypothetical protein